jgi:N-acetylglucosaminyl-diphospho-decaprenol L-rhamnosyltransferase
MDVDVGIIYTYEDRFMTPLVMSLARSADGVRMRMILIDNASERGVGPWSDAHEGTIVLRNRNRLGYAENLNRILEASTARYTLLLNTDMIFAPHEQCLTKMVRFMDLHPECGIGGCRLFHGDGSYAFPARRFQSMRTIVARRLGMSVLMPHTVKSYFYLDQPHDRLLECDWLSGCFLMARRAAVDEVGLLDPQFRKYFEDVDFCLRMARAGWKVMLNGETFAYHLEQRSSRRLLSRDAWLHLQSYGRWLWKWGLDPHRHIVPRPHFDLRPETQSVESKRRAA